MGRKKVCRSWWVCLLTMTICQSAWAQDIYITTSNSGILKANGGGWSTFCPLNGFHELVPDGENDFYAIRSNNIYKIDSSGMPTVFATGVLTNSYGMARDNSGNLLVANSSDNSIQMVDPSGVVSLFSDSAALDRPFDLAFDSKGTLYVSNEESYNILKMEPGGSFSVFASGLDCPMGMIFDSDDNLYVACNADDTIVRIAPDGNVALFAPTAPISHPWSVALDPAGDLYLASYWSDNVLRFDSAGQSSVFATLPGNSVPYFITIVPEPATLSLLAFGGLAMLRRRK